MRTRTTAAFTALVLSGLGLQAGAAYLVNTADPTAATPITLQTVDDINKAEMLFDPANAATRVTASPNPTVINFMGLGQGNGGDFGGDLRFPNGVDNTDDFSLEALAKLLFNTSGNYVFRVNSDDGFRLRGNTNADG